MKPSAKAACCPIPTVWPSGKGKATETVNGWVVAKGSGVGGEGRAQRIFRAMKLPWVVLQWWTDTFHFYASVQTHRKHTTTSDCRVDSGLWVVSMCQCRFLSCNKCTAVGRDVDSGGGCAYVGAVGIQDIPVPSPQFCCNP